MLNTTTVSSKRQVTIPKRIADAVGLKTGDQLAVRMEHHTGEIIFRPRTGDLTKLFGILPDVKIPKGKTLDDLIDEARTAYLTKKYQRLGFLRKRKT